MKMPNRKYLIRIKGTSAEKTVIRRVQNDLKTIIIDKEKKGFKKQALWSFTFERQSVINTRRFGMWWPTIDVVYGATKACTIDLEGKTIQTPFWDKDTSHKFITTELIKALSSALSEGYEQLKSMVTINLMATIILFILTMYGFWKFGVFR
jgi:hypothetical protein